MSLELPPRWLPVNLVQLSPVQVRHVQSYADAYARAAQRMALEEAAKVCAPHSDDDAMDRAAKAECAAAIRKLADQV